ncbi:MAG: CsbD family protein [Actinomycetota bacterium]|nr:CsbD family protein [Actinomycetota bacterium]
MTTEEGAQVGAFEEAKGKIKQATGDLSDNPDLQREGEAQSEKGEAEKEATEARAEARARDAEAKAREAEQRGAERLK